MTEGGALPKGFERPNEPGSPNSSDSASSSTPKSGNNKLGISIAIGITAVAIAFGIGFTGVIPMDENMPSVMQPTPSAPSEPVVQQAPPSPPPVIQAKPPTYTPIFSAHPSYEKSDGNLIDQLDWSISDGDVKSMHIDKKSSSLIIKTSTMDDVELFVGLNADYIGSDDGTFFIIVDNQEHEDYEQAGMDLYIDLPAGAETVEIIGSYAQS